MPPGLTHERCREEMCLGCGGRAGKNRVTEALGEKFKRWAQPSWSPEVMSHPRGCCEPCRQAVLLCEKQQTTKISSRAGVVERWGKFQLEWITVPRGQMADSCVCLICRARKVNPVGKAGPKNVNHNQIKQEVEEDVKEEGTTKSCPTCFQEKVGRGIPHKCTEANKAKNLADIVIKQKESEQIVTKVLKNVIKDKGEGSNEVKLKQLEGGKDLTVSMGKRKLEKESVVDAETVAKVKKQLDLSKRNTKKFLKIMRQGNVKVEEHVMEITVNQGGVKMANRKQPLSRTPKTIFQNMFGICFRGLRVPY